MKQEIFCYIKGKEEVSFLKLDGSLEVYDILVDFIDQVSEISEQSHRDVLHTVAGRLQTLANEEGNKC